MTEEIKINLIEKEIVKVSLIEKEIVKASLIEKEGVAISIISPGEKGLPVSLKDLSNPPSGDFKITNIFVNASGKLIIEYDNTPTQ